MRWVRAQPCLIKMDHDCDGPVQADHAGDIGVRALGRKADDKTCLPLCVKAHMERQRWRGYFADWGVIRMREWTEAMSAVLWDRYYQETGCRTT